MEYKTKKEQRELIRHIIVLRNEQIKDMQKLVLIPLLDNRAIANNVLKGTEPIQKLFKHSEYINKLLSDLFKK